MLIEFAVTNFRSFKERQVLSLLPSGKIRERYILPVQSERYAKVQVLPTAVLYGPNNAGKSNFLRALEALKWLITGSGRFNSDTELQANEFFILNTQTKNQPSIFEIDFIAPNQKRYVYTIKFNSSKILVEELYCFNISPKGKTTIITLFLRSEQNIKFPSLKGERESVKFAANQLFLSRADIEGNEDIKQVYTFFAKKIFSYQFTETEYTDFLAREYAKFASSNQEDSITKLTNIILREMDTGILGLETNLSDITQFSFLENMSQQLKDKLFEQLKYELKTRHKLFNGKEEIGEEFMPLEKQSTGTRKLLALIPLIFPALREGKTLFIDEINTSMHSDITAWLVGLFNDIETNPNHAQLIITTHDISLLRKFLYDKDQVFIVNKNKYGESEMYSFTDVTGLRASDNLAEFYETGRMGGVPYIFKPYLQHSISQFLADAKTEAK
jgi:uncharacterized protein